MVLYIISRTINSNNFININQSFPYEEEKNKVKAIPVTGPGGL
jgi:hypothetical protein